MEQFGLALILFAAFWVGCAAGYIAMRLRAQVAYEKGRNEAAADISALTERLSGRDTQFNEARQRADAGAETIARMETELRTEIDRRTVAEARLTLVPKYEAEVEARGHKIAEQQRELTKFHVTVSELTTRLEEMKKTSEDKINAIQALQNRVSESFQSLSAEALMTNNKAFLDLAGDALTRLQDSARGDLDQRQTLFGQIMEPLKSSLDRVDTRITELERERATAYAGLQQQVESMMRTQASLQAETSHLASALRTPSSRGRWGEVQLRRVVELAGMISHCDFVETRATEDAGAASRPDLVVQLPNFRQIVVDSKISLAAYLEANDATDEETRAAKRRQHAAEVRAHVTQLSAKGYWDQFPQSPEFVIAFLPGEAFFSAALEHDPELLEFGVERRVILATPTTLIALLRAVAWGWKQEMVSSNAREIRDLGKALYDRLRGLADNFTEVQRGLSRTTAAFNRTVGAFESSVIPTARRMRELGASTGDEIVSPPPVDTNPRSLHLLAEATEATADTEMEKVEAHAAPLARIKMAAAGSQPGHSSAASSTQPLSGTAVISHPEPVLHVGDARAKAPAPQLQTLAKPAAARHTGAAASAPAAANQIPPANRSATFIAPPPAKPAESAHRNHLISPTAPGQARPAEPPVVPPALTGHSPAGAAPSLDRPTGPVQLRSPITAASDNAKATPHSIVAALPNQQVLAAANNPKASQEAPAAPAPTTLAVAATDSTKPAETTPGNATPSPGASQAAPHAVVPTTLAVATPDNMAPVEPAPAKATPSPVASQEAPAAPVPTTLAVATPDNATPAEPAPAKATPSPVAGQEAPAAVVPTTLAVATPDNTAPAEPAPAKATPSPVASQEAPAAVVPTTLAVATPDNATPAEPAPAKATPSPVASQEVPAAVVPTTLAVATPDNTAPVEPAPAKATPSPVASQEVPPAVVPTTLAVATPDNTAPVEPAPAKATPSPVAGQEAPSAPVPTTLVVATPDNTTPVEPVPAKATPSPVATAASQETPAIPGNPTPGQASQVANPTQDKSDGTDAFALSANGGTKGPVTAGSADSDSRINNTPQGPEPVIVLRFAPPVQSTAEIPTDALPAAPETISAKSEQSSSIATAPVGVAS